MRHQLGEGRAPGRVTATTTAADGTAGARSAVAAGITINGLPIVNDRLNPWGGRPPANLDRYYEELVIGGPGAFIVVAEDYTAFASAILSKLLLEIAGDRPSSPSLAAR